MQIDRLLSASKTSPAETRSNNSGRYTLLKSHIPWEVVHGDLKARVGNEMLEGIVGKY